MTFANEEQRDPVRAPAKESRPSRKDDVDDGEGPCVTEYFATEVLVTFPQPSRRPAHSRPATNVN